MHVIVSQVLEQSEKMLISVIRSARNRPLVISTILPSSQKLPGVRFQSDNMEKTNNPTDPRSGDVMSNSFGEGYATRSDEEGFGGTYGGDKAAQNIEQDKKIHENHPAYDKTQGSEVKEKERARHQTNAD